MSLGCLFSFMQELHVDVISSWQVPALRPCLLDIVITPYQISVHAKAICLPPSQQLVPKGQAGRM